MRAVIYCRVSSAQQRDAHTIASQLRLLPEYVARQGWELVRPANTYVDDGRSASAGKLDKREGFARLLRDAASGCFDVVAVVDLDRITRADDMAERGLIMGSFQRAGVQIAPMSGQTVDLSTITGDLLASLQMAISAEENKKRKERFARGCEEAVRKGRKPRGKTPYGLRYDRATGAWSEHEEEAPILREIYERLNGGEAAMAIGRDLEKRGVPSPRGGFWQTSIWRLITETTYRGTLVVHNKKGLSIPVPRLVDDATWYAAQDAMTRSGRRGLRRTKHIYLCEGIMVCSLCSAAIWVHREAKATANGRAYYQCSRRRRPFGNEPPCKLPMRRVDEVDGLLWREISALLSRPDLAELVGMHRHQKASEGERWRQDLAEFERRMKRLEQAETAILDRYRKGLISESAMDANLKASAKERAFLGRQISTAQQQQSTPEPEVDSAALLEALRLRIRATSPAEKRELVVSLISGQGALRVVLGPRSMSATAVFPSGKTAKLRAVSSL